MRTGLFCVTGYQNLFFTVPYALLEFPGAELGRRGWTGRKGNTENHLADGVAVQGEVQRSPAVPCSPQSTALYPSTASALCGKYKNPVPAHGVSELGMCVWATDKAELAAVGCPLPEDLGSRDIPGARLLHFTEKWKGKCAVVRTLPVPAVGS